MSRPAAHRPGCKSPSPAGTARSDRHRSGKPHQPARGAHRRARNADGRSVNGPAFVLLALALAAACFDWVAVHQEQKAPRVRLQAAHAGAPHRLRAGPEPRRRRRARLVRGRARALPHRRRLPHAPAGPVRARPRRRSCWATSPTSSGCTSTASTAPVPRRDRDRDGPAGGDRHAHPPRRAGRTGPRAGRTGGRLHVRDLGHGRQRHRRRPSALACWVRRSSTRATRSSRGTASSPRRATAGSPSSSPTTSRRWAWCSAWCSSAVQPRLPRARGARR